MELCCSRLLLGRGARRPPRRKSEASRTIYISNRVLQLKRDSPGLFSLATAPCVRLAFGIRVARSWSGIPLQQVADRSCNSSLGPSNRVNEVGVLAASDPTITTPSITHRGRDRPGSRLPGFCTQAYMCNSHELNSQRPSYTDTGIRWVDGTFTTCHMAQLASPRELAWSACVTVMILGMPTGRPIACGYACTAPVIPISSGSTAESKVPPAAPGPDLG